MALRKIFVLSSLMLTTLILAACGQLDPNQTGDTDGDSSPDITIIFPNYPYADGDQPDGDNPDGDIPSDGDEPSDGDTIIDGDQPDGDDPDGDQPDGDNLDGDYPDGDKPDGDQPDGDQPDGDDPDGDQPDGDQPDGDQPDGDQPDGDQPDGDQPDGDQPDGDQPDGDQPDGDQPDGDQPDGDQPDGDQPDGDQPDGDQPDGDQPDGDQPDGDQPDGDQPDGDQPDGDQPDGDQPDGDQPDGDIPPDGDQPDGDIPPDGDEPDGDAVPDVYPNGEYNYGKALQKAIFFYDCQRAGELPNDNRVMWRGDSCLDDGRQLGVDLSGGYFDAGDHVKFGLPMAATTTLLAWSVIEFQQAYSDVGQLQEIRQAIKWATDYFLKAHIAPHELVGQVGNGGQDHSWWGPAEVMPMDRPIYKITESCPGSDLAAETAAAMAAAAIVFADLDPSYAATLRAHAVQLYDFADNYRGKYSDCITDASAYYNSWSGYDDELVWGALWMYLATGQSGYLTKAKNGYNNIAGATHWTHNWDDKRYGAYLLLTMLTGEETYRQNTEAWLNQWTVGNNGQRITYTPGGLAWLDQWGSLRYSANTAFLALVYARYLEVNGASASLIERYKDFAAGQIDYMLGDNPRNASYVVGFGDNPPTKPHHRTAHGSWKNSITTPAENRHILYGALVGGPDRNDNYNDDRTDYVKNEVATDYNAGFTGALAGLVELYGGQSDPSFPQSEDRDDEIFVEAKINVSNPRFIEIAARLYNQSAWPARETENLSFRYYVDLSEVFEAGYGLSDITLSTAYNQGGQLSDQLIYDAYADLYYLEVSFDGVMLAPGQDSTYRKEVQFRIGLPTNTNDPDWDNSNDPSFSGIGTSYVMAQNIPVYDNGVLCHGEEP